MDNYFENIQNSINKLSEDVNDIKNKNQDNASNLDAINNTLRDTLSKDSYYSGQEHLVEVLSKTVNNKISELSENIDNVGRAIGVDSDNKSAEFRGALESLSGKISSLQDVLKYYSDQKFIEIKNLINPEQIKLEFNIIKDKIAEFQNTIQNSSATSYEIIDKFSAFANRIQELFNSSANISQKQVDEFKTGMTAFNDNLSTLAKENELKISATLNETSAIKKDVLALKDELTKFSVQDLNLINEKFESLFVELSRLEHTFTEKNLSVLREGLGYTQESFDRILNELEKVQKNDNGLMNSSEFAAIIEKTDLLKNELNLATTDVLNNLSSQNDKLYQNIASVLDVSTKILSENSIINTNISNIKENIELNRTKIEALSESVNAFQGNISNLISDKMQGLSQDANYLVQNLLKAHEKELRTGLSSDSQLYVERVLQANEKISELIATQIGDLKSIVLEQLSKSVSTEDNSNVQNQLKDEIEIIFKRALEHIKHEDIIDKFEDAKLSVQNQIKNLRIGISEELDSKIQDFTTYFSTQDSMLKISADIKRTMNVLEKKVVESNVNSTMEVSKLLFSLLNEVANVKSLNEKNLADINVVAKQSEINDKLEKTIIDSKDDIKKVLSIQHPLIKQIENLTQKEDLESMQQSIKEILVVFNTKIDELIEASNENKNKEDIRNVIDSIERNLNSFGKEMITTVVNVFNDINFNEEKLYLEKVIRDKAESVKKVSAENYTNLSYQLNEKSKEILNVSNGVKTAILNEIQENLAQKIKSDIFAISSDIKNVINLKDMEDTDKFSSLVTSEQFQKYSREIDKKIQQISDTLVDKVSETLASDTSKMHLEGIEASVQQLKDYYTDTLPTLMTSDKYQQGTLEINKEINDLKSYIFEQLPNILTSEKYQEFSSELERKFLSMSTYIAESYSSLLTLEKYKENTQELEKNISDLKSYIAETYPTLLTSETYQNYTREFEEKIQTLINYFRENYNTLLNSNNTGEQLQELDKKLQSLGNVFLNSFGSLLSVEQYQENTQNLYNKFQELKEQVSESYPYLLTAEKYQENTQILENRINELSSYVENNYPKLLTTDAYIEYSKDLENKFQQISENVSENTSKFLTTEKYQENVQELKDAVQALKDYVVNNYSTLMTTENYQTQSQMLNAKMQEIKDFISENNSSNLTSELLNQYSQNVDKKFDDMRAFFENSYNFLVEVEKYRADVYELNQNFRNLKTYIENSYENLLSNDRYQEDIQDLDKKLQNITTYIDNAFQDISSYDKLRDNIQDIEYSISDLKDYVSNNYSELLTVEEYKENTSAIEDKLNSISEAIENNKDASNIEEYRENISAINDKLNLINYTISNQNSINPEEYRDTIKVLDDKLNLISEAIENNKDASNIEEYKENISAINDKLNLINYTISNQNSINPEEYRDTIKVLNEKLDIISEAIENNQQITNAEEYKNALKVLDEKLVIISEAIENNKDASNIEEYKENISAINDKLNLINYTISNQNSINPEEYRDTIKVLNDKLDIISETIENNKNSINADEFRETIKFLADKLNESIENNKDASNIEEYIENISAINDKLNLINYTISNQNSINPEEYRDAIKVLNDKLDIISETIENNQQITNAEEYKNALKVLDDKLNMINNTILVNKSYLTVDEYRDNSQRLEGIIYDIKNSLVEDFSNVLTLDKYYDSIHILETRITELEEYIKTDYPKVLTSDEFNTRIQNFEENINNLKQFTYENSSNIIDAEAFSSQIREIDEKIQDFNKYISDKLPELLTTDEYREYSVVLENNLRQMSDYFIQRLNNLDIIGDFIKDSTQSLDYKIDNIKTDIVDIVKTCIKEALDESSLINTINDTNFEKIFEDINTNLTQNLDEFSTNLNNVIETLSDKVSSLTGEFVSQTNEIPEEFFTNLEEIIVSKADDLEHLSNENYQKICDRISEAQDAIEEIDNSIYECLQKNMPSLLGKEIKDGNDYISSKIDKLADSLISNLKDNEDTSKLIEEQTKYFEAAITQLKLELVAIFKIRLRDDLETQPQAVQNTEAGNNATVYDLQKYTDDVLESISLNLKGIVENAIYPVISELKTGGASVQNVNGDFIAEVMSSLKTSFEREMRVHSNEIDEIKDSVQQNTLQITDLTNVLSNLGNNIVSVISDKLNVLTFNTADGVNIESATVDVRPIVNEKLQDIQETVHSELKNIEAATDSLYDEIIESVNREFDRILEDYYDKLNQEDLFDKLDEVQNDINSQIDIIRADLCDQISVKMDDFREFYITQTDMANLSSDIKKFLNNLEDKVVETNVNTTMEISKLLFSLLEEVSSLKAVIAEENPDLMKFVKKFSTEQEINSNTQQVSSESDKEIEDALLEDNEEDEIIDSIAEPDFENIETIENEGTIDIKDSPLNDDDENSEKLDGFNTLYPNPIPKDDSAINKQQAIVLQKEVKDLLLEYGSKLDFIIRTTKDEGVKSDIKSVIASVEKTLNTFGQEMITSVVGVFNGINFDVEKQEILDFIRIKTKETNYFINELKNDLKKLISDEEEKHIDVKNDLDVIKKMSTNIDSTCTEISTDLTHVKERLGQIHEKINENEGSYTFEDVETDILKVRMILKELTETNALARDIGLEKIEEDLVSISTRTNKLLLNSDETSNYLQNSIEDLKTLVALFDNKVNELDYQRIFVKLESRLQDITNIVHANAIQNKKLTEAFTYLAEWIDKTDEKLYQLEERINDVKYIKKNMIDKNDLETLFERMLENFDKQQEKIEMLEEKVQVLSRREVETKLAKKVDGIDRQLATLGRNIEKITSYVD